MRQGMVRDLTDEERRRFRLCGCPRSGFGYQFHRHPCAATGLITETHPEPTDPRRSTT